MRNIKRFTTLLNGCILNNSRMEHSLLVHTKISLINLDRRSVLFMNSNNHQDAKTEVKEETKKDEATESSIVEKIQEIGQYNSQKVTNSKVKEVTIIGQVEE